MFFLLICIKIVTINIKNLITWYFFSTLVKQILIMNNLIYFLANEIKNVLKLNLNSVEKIRTFLEHLKLKIAIFLRTLNLGLKNVVLIKKKECSHS